MEKVITIGSTEVRLSNNVGWTLAYRDQFGQDIIPTLMPMIAASFDVISGIITATGKTEEIEAKDLLAILDGDTVMDAVIHLSGLEFTDLLKITWAMAKCADNNILPLQDWVKQFDSFPVDEIAPSVFDLLLKGVISSKNLTRLKNLTASLQPVLTSIHSSSPDSNED